MKNSRSARWLPGLLLALPALLSAQCPITVDVGPDFLVCSFPQQIQLNGSISGLYQDFSWSPTPSNMTGANTLTPTVTATAPAYFILTGRMVDESVNLIVNGDFEQGNTGFTSNYIYSPTNLVPFGRYDVLSNPQSANDAFAACGDHTSGSGNMLAAHASVSQNSVWCQTVNLEPFSEYQLSYWMTNIYGSPREIKTLVNPPTVIHSQTPVPEYCNWTQASMVFSTTTNASAMICLNTYKSFNESGVAIDDIVLHPICRVQDTVFIKKANIIAKASPEAYSIPCIGNEVTLHGTGSSTGPQYTYSWETQDGNIVSGQNTLHPVVNMPGTYTLIVAGENMIGDCEKTAVAVVEEVNPLQVSISGPQALACTGTTLLVGNSTATSDYQWEAGAGGNIVSGANSAFVQVNQPGEYYLTVTNTATGCTAESMIAITAPIQPVANIQPPGILLDDTDTLTLAAEVMAANVTFNWTTTDGLIASGGNTPTPTVAAPGIYILTVTNSANGCTDTDTVWVSKALECPITVNAGEDIYLCNPPQQIQLNGLIDGTYVKLEWSPIAGMSDIYSLSPTVSVGQNSKYVLTGIAIDPTNNLVFNGDFEQGNIGFTSEMDYSPGDLVPLGTYDVTANPQSSNDNFEPCGDHTSGGSNMLVSNMPYEWDIDIWCQTISVTPNTEYYFSCWAASVGSNHGRMSFYINGVSAAITPNLTPACEWMLMDGLWNSGNLSSVEICIHKGKITSFAEAIDDIYFGPVCKVRDTVEIHITDLKAQVSTTSTALPCDGATIALNGTGSSTGPHIFYHWDTPDGNIVSGENTLNPLVNATGTYTLTVDALNGVNCAETASVLVTENPVPLQTWITGPQNFNCNTPTILLQGNSNQPATTIYQWTAGSGGHIASGTNNATATVDQPGDYQLVITNTATGCTAEAGINVDPPILPTATATAAAITCASPQTTLSGSGSSSGVNFNHAWSTTNGNIVSGQNNINAIADTAGIYVLLVTNTTTGCTNTDTVAVTLNAVALPVQILSPDTLTCLQNAIILATDSTTAGAHRTYHWTAHDGGNIVSGADSLFPIVNAPGVYILLVTDTLNACTGADTIAVNADNDAIVAIANAPEVITCLNTSITLDADGSTFNPTFQYQWNTPDGHIISSSDTPNPTADAPGTYHLLMTNPANGCTATDAAIVTSDLAVPDVALEVQGVLNCNTDSVLLASSSNTDPTLLQHHWTLPDGSSVSTGNNPVLDATLPGAFQLLLTNTQNGCTSTTSVIVTQQTAVVVDLVAQQNASCFADADGALNVAASGGNNNFTYLWSNGQNSASITGLTAGVYAVTVTDGEQCSAVQTFTINAPAELLAGATATPPSGIGASDGTASANPQGGTAPYAFLWNTGQSTATISGIPAGFYTVTVTDFQGCTAVQTIEVWGGACNLLATVQAVDPKCHGAADGQATALPTGSPGPFSYQWTSGSMDQTATGLAAGVHEVSIIDANGCSFSVAVVLGQPPLLEIFIENLVNTPCPGSAEGSVMVQTTGGTGAADWLWSNGQQGPVATGLPAGLHTVTVTDANGCTATTAATIQSIDLEAPQISGTPATIELGPSGSVEINAQNLGITVQDNCGAFSVQIAPDAFDCFDLGPQQITVTAEDASGNVASLAMTVTFVDNEVPQLQCPPGITRCATEQVVEYAAPVAIDNCLVLGGNFTLVSGLPSGSVFPQGATVNMYNFTDVSGNAGTCSFAVNVLSPITVSVDSIVHDIGNQQTGAIAVSVTGSQPGYSYAWLQNGQIIATTEDLANAGAGTYNLLVTDAAGCTTSAGPLEVSNLSGTDSPGWADRIGIYPNPATGSIFVVLPLEMVTSEISFEVFDATGRRMLTQHSSTQKQVEIDFTNFAAGLYSIWIRTDQGQAGKILVKL